MERGSEMREESLIIDPYTGLPVETAPIKSGVASILPEDSAAEIYNLVSKNDSILKEKIEPFDFSKPPVDPKELAENLVATMVRHNGLGLAANQCGLRYRAFAVNTHPNYLVCFNPRIVDFSKEENLLDEGCLSFPYLIIKIKRPRGIRVRFTDYTGETFTEKFDGITARIFQHEADHLEGIVFTSKANWFHMQKAEKDMKSHLRRERQIEKEHQQSLKILRDKKVKPDLIPFKDFPRTLEELDKK